MAVEVIEVAAGKAVGLWGAMRTVGATTLLGLHRADFLDAVRGEDEATRAAEDIVARRLPCPKAACLAMTARGGRDGVQRRRRAQITR